MQRTALFSGYGHLAARLYKTLGAPPRVVAGRDFLQTVSRSILGSAPAGSTVWQHRLNTGKKYLYGIAFVPHRAPYNTAFGVNCPLMVNIKHPEQGWVFKDNGIRLWDFRDADIAVGELTGIVPERGTVWTRMFIPLLIPVQNGQLLELEERLYWDHGPGYDAAYDVVFWYTDELPGDKAVQERLAARKEWPILNACVKAARKPDFTLTGGSSKVQVIARNLTTDDAGISGQTITLDPEFDRCTRIAIVLHTPIPNPIFRNFRLETMNGDVVLDEVTPQLFNTADGQNAVGSITRRLIKVDLPVKGNTLRLTEKVAAVPSSETLSYDLAFFLEKHR